MYLQILKSLLHKFYNVTDSGVAYTLKARFFKLLTNLLVYSDYQIVIFGQLLVIQTLICFGNNLGPELPLVLAYNRQWRAETIWTASKNRSILHHSYQASQPESSARYPFQGTADYLSDSESQIASERGFTKLNRSYQMFNCCQTT